MFAQQTGNAKSAAALLGEAVEMIDELEVRQKVQSFDIAKHFNYIWHTLAVARAAWEQTNWNTADRLLEAALSLVKINPCANKLLA